MKKKITLIILFLLCIFCIYKIKQYSDKKEEKKQQEIQQQEQEKQAYIDKLEEQNKKFMELLRLEGDFEITGDGVSVSDLQCDKGPLCILVYYYNYYNDDDISCELILHEYDNFCKGSEDYKHLMDYTDFIIEMYEFKNEEISPEKIHVDIFFNECFRVIRKEYGKRYKYLYPLSEEEYKHFCDLVMEQKYELYLQDLESRVDYDFHPSLLLEYSYEEITSTEVNNIILETGEEIISEEFGDIVYYRPYKDWYTGEEEYRVYKFIILEKSKDIGDVMIGTKRENVKPRFEKNLQGFQLVEEKRDKLVYALGNLYVTLQFNEDGECNRMTMEIKD